ncbi:MAG: Gldg family protein [Nitrospirales bacterium]|nr:Gldg family protein [Nitrospira sp.]MDR4500853.1 Gldg family protein [Nitrospirales bacterium]
MNKKFLTGTGLILAVVLFGAANMLSNAALSTARFDLTEHRLYTLSEGTKNIMQNLDEPITLKLYLSKKLATGLPGIKSYANRVEEMLEEFEQVSGGDITLQVIDPEPFSEEEDRAVAYGLQGVPLEGGTKQFYFGMVGTSSTDEQEVIPFFQPEREEFLEYDLAKLVYTLAHPKKQVLGVISSLPIEGGPPMPMMPQSGGGEPWLIMDHIRQLVEVKTIEKNATEIPEDVSVLMLVHPKHLSDETLYAIDQFVLRGGRALVFIDPHSEADRGMATPNNPFGGTGPKNSDLGKLSEAWGVELVKGKVVGDLPLAKKVQIQQQGRPRVLDYPVWIGLEKAYMSADDIVTAQIPNLNLASAGILKKKEGSETELIPLLHSDDAAMQIPASSLAFMPDVAAMLNSYKPGGEELILAARIRGTAKSAFPDGKPKSKSEESDKEKKEDESEGPPQKHLATSQEPINVIVVADTDLLQDRFWVQVQNFFGQRIGIPNAGNGNFVTNAIDNLGGSNDLISVRSRSGFSRPFTLVRSIQQDAEQQFRQKEQALQNRLKATEQKIQNMQSQKQEGNALILSPEQQEEIAKFRQELVEVRKELRGVQHELVKNIDGLESWVKFFNIGFVPILIGAAGFWVGSKHMRRRKKT